MATFKKKDFVSNKPIEELVDNEGGMIGGDRNITSNSEIETGPVMKPYNDDTDYEKGISTTTDRAARYKQDIPWFANYAAGQRAIANETKQIITKKAMEEKVEDLVKKSKFDSEILDKNYSGNMDKIMSLIDSTDLSTHQLDAIISAADSKKNTTDKKKL